MHVLACERHGPTLRYTSDHHEQRPRCPDPRCHRYLERVEVVYRDDYDELCQVAQDLYETVVALLPPHGDCSCDDDATCPGCRARAVIKGYMR